MNNITTTGFDKLCSTILETNENIQSVSIINKHGRAIERRVQDKTSVQTVNQKNEEMFFMQCALTVSMGRDFDDEFGEIGYIHVDRKNLSMLSFPLFDNIVLVTSKAAMSPITLARKISAIIKKHCMQDTTAHTLEEGHKEMPKSMIQVSMHNP